MGAISFSKKFLEVSGSFPESMNPETYHHPKSSEFWRTLAISLCHLSGNFRNQPETVPRDKFGSPITVLSPQPDSNWRFSKYREFFEPMEWNSEDQSSFLLFFKV
jgi:hypothetical protein